MKTQCNCHVLFCFLSLTLLAAQVSVCKQSLSPFHSIAPLQIRAQPVIPVLTFRGAPGAPCHTQHTQTCCMVTSPIWASEGIPAQPRESKAWQALGIPPTAKELQGCSDDVASHLPLCHEPDAATLKCCHLHRRATPCSYGQGGKEGSAPSFPACAELLGCITPKNELQPDLGR